MFFLFPIINPYGMRLAFLRGLGKRVLGCCLEVGKLSCYINNQMGFPQLLLPCCWAGAVPQQHAATFTPLPWDEDNNPAALCTHCASPASPCWGHPGPAQSLCQHPTVLSAPWGGQPCWGPRAIQRSRAQALLAGVTAPPQGSLSTSCVALACDTHKQRGTLSKIFVLSCTSLQ